MPNRIYRNAPYLIQVYLLQYFLFVIQKTAFNELLPLQIALDVNFLSIH